MSVVSMITRHLPGWPAGSPGEIDDAAAVWRSVARQLGTLTDELHQQIGSLGASWQGPGKDSFTEEWTQLAAASEDACTQLEDLAARLRGSASRLRAAQQKYKEIEGAAAVTFAIGLAASVMTFGASDAAAGEMAASEVAAAAADAAEATSLVALALQAAQEIALQIVTRFVVFSAIDLGAQAAIAALVFPDHDPFAHWDVRAAVAAGVGQSSPELELASPGTTIVAQGLSDGTADAASQAIGTGHVDPAQVAGSAVLGGGIAAWRAHKPAE
jgi:WXG100 family type VII secretion target